MTKISKVCRNHLHFIIIVPLLIIVMTWPTIAHVFDTSTFWLAGSDIDSNMLFWDAWYGKLIVSGKADFYYTDLLFHPEGLSLAFHNFSVPHMILLGLLQEVMPAANAYNLTYLALAFASALTAYIYLNYLFRDKWIALFGAIVFGTSGFVLTRPAHPNVSVVASLPLSLYFFHRAIREGRWRYIVAAGISTGLTAFIGMYTLVCLLISLALYIMYFAISRWNERMFWLRVCLLGLVAAGFLFLRFYPMVADPAGLSGALAKDEGEESHKDLLAYFFNNRHPFTGPILKSAFSLNRTAGGWWQTVYLGYLPLALIAYAIARRKSRQKILPWLVLLLLFLLLRLGSTLMVNGLEYENLRLPKYYLAEIFPQIFKPFWSNKNFQAGVLLPFAVLTCYGLLKLLQSIPARRRTGFILILSAIIAFEYYSTPKPLVMPAGQLKFIDWLGEEEDQESIRLINLPMGTQQSKLYGFFQTYNGYQHVEGHLTRTPPYAYDYIDSNLILSAWRKREALYCLPANQDAYLPALDQLVADGFTHLVLHDHDHVWLHHRFWKSAALRQILSFMQPAYEDGYVIIYRLNDLRGYCPPVTMFNRAGFLPQFKNLLLSPDALPALPKAIVSLHPAESVEAGIFRYASIVASGGKDLIHIYRGDDAISLQSADERYKDLETFLSANQSFLLLYDPSQTVPEHLEFYRDGIARHFNTCKRVMDKEDTVIDYYVKLGFPCELVTSENSFAVDYINGIQLGNLLRVLDGSALDFYFLWETLLRETHAISIQIFDEAGAKIHGQDFVISKQLAQQRVDLSSLPTGDYLAKLILYNYDTGASVPGSVTSSQTRFDRELEIGRITID